MEIDIIGLLSAFSFALDCVEAELIHVGINTVELEGKYYKALVKEGDKVTKGQPLLKFDIEGIRSAGYNTVTPVIITNSDEYESVEQVAIGDVEKSALVMKVR